MKGKRINAASLTPPSPHPFKEGVKEGEGRGMRIHLK
jgi:hypothetical protein